MNSPRRILLIGAAVIAVIGVLGSMMFQQKRPAASEYATPPAITTAPSPAPTESTPPVPPRATPPPAPRPLTRGGESLAAPKSANPNIISGSAFRQVRVFFATDRKPLPDQIGVFRGARGSGLTYGHVFISVPAGHEVGQVERPSIWRLEFTEDPQRHMVIMRRNVLNHDDFFAQIRRNLTSSEKSQSFVFIHGYNVSFDDAARRTAQITYDLDFNGVPVFYSWPSQASLQGYTIDENNVEWSQANLQAFLLDYARNSQVEDIYLIAHSMGNRALAGALRHLFAEHPKLRPRFKEIILTAPDIDADIFRRDIAPALTGSGNPAGEQNKVTLYVSNGDKALLASQGLHGYSRIGDANEGIVLVDGVDTVDASGLDTSFLEHSYFAETRSVLGDIKRLVLERLRPDHRGLNPVKLESETTYWTVLNEHGQAPEHFSE